MSRFTKKYMIEDYERLRNHADLLELYLWDTQSEFPRPDAVESAPGVRVWLYRATSASGGYVVIMQSIANVWYLDDAIRMYADNHSEHTLGIRICLERLRVKRNKLYDASMGGGRADSEMVQAAS